MSLDQLKRTSSRWNFFSKVDLLGALDFWTLTVSLDSLIPQETAGLTVKDISPESRSILEFSQYERHKKALTLAAHEYTHFVDATSSLWGLQHLRYIDMCNSVDKLDESQFHVLKKSYDYMRTIRLPDYYTTVDKGVQTNRPWRSNVTCGVLFSKEGTVTDRPVIFVGFLSTGRSRFVRSPISLVSLLEASAMAKEIEVRHDLLSRLSADERKVESHQVNEEILSYLYNPNVTEYSVCFHLLANFQNQKDIFVVSRCAGVLARMVLSVPSIGFKTASKNLAAYASTMKLTADDLEVKRVRSALEQENRGALYFLIVVLLPLNSLQSEARFFAGLESALKKIGLSSEKLRRAALDEANALHETLSRSDLEPIRLLARSGLSNFLKIFPKGLNYQLKTLSLPPALLGDNEMTQYSFNSSDENQLVGLDIEAAYDELVQCQLRAENFAEACI